MTHIEGAVQTSVTEGRERRAAVMKSALATFARFGYRKTSMEEVARAARISRQGLYFLFTSKAQLFREVMSQTLWADITEVERLLAEPDRPLRDRLVAAFDQWAGRHVGPMARDVAALIETNPEILGDIAEVAPQRFSALVTGAIALSAVPQDRQRAEALAQTLISTSIGIKYQVGRRDDYVARFALAVDLLLR